MPIVPVNVARVSQYLKSFTLLNTVQSSNLNLFRIQNQLATGLKFQAPSQDPRSASQALRLDRRLDTIKQVEQNLNTVNATMRSGESAMQDTLDMMIEANTLALQTAGDTASPDERAALATIVDSLIESLVSVGNRTHLGSYLFSGHVTSAPPFELNSQGVRFNGDNGRREAIIDTDYSQDFFTISGQEFFNAVSAGVRGTVDLDPALTTSTRLVDLRGANADGIRMGRIEVSDGSTTSTIDLTNADTIGDVIDRLNDEMPPTLQATFTANAINISPTVVGPLNVTVFDVAGGTTAVDLGIAMTTPAPAILGADLDPILTNRTRIDDLVGGAGLSLTSAIRLRVGEQTADINLSSAETIEDVLNRINQSGIGVEAKISDDGKSIDIFNRVSGPALSIEELGGNTAQLLGIRSSIPTTPLSELNEGRGLDSVDGDDIRITTSNGTVIDIDLDAIDLDNGTIQDLLDLLNTAGGGAITARLADIGSGIELIDNTGGGGLQLERLNVSPALDSLGFQSGTFAGGVVGDDIHPLRVDSPFTALLDLREALQADDTRAIGFAAERLQDVMPVMQRIQGQLASKARAMLDREERLTSEKTATEIMQSDVRDVDLAEAIVRFQQQQIALQANLSTSSQVLRLNLFDFLQ
ncbi:MAG: flagellar hook-associated protein FlgL [Phycisphaerales bacterium]|nr:flagellar hook-associated protein FlgL [Phycisphaerales bacterium]